MAPASSFLWTLAAQLGREWPHLRAAEAEAAAERARLETVLDGAIPEDCSLVVFGSLARGEFTVGSDLDWTLLIDGRADRAHPRVARDVAARLAGAGSRAPGPSGVFGNLAFSHPILHQIGGQDDTNRNTTQRILLLLESAAVGRPEAHERVLRMVLDRYVEDDRGLMFGSGGQILPRVLLNDISRYWRTLTIDFVSKQKERDRGWGLRNVKLKLSRKLIYVHGLLTCFAAQLHPERAALLGESGRPLADRLVEFLLQRTRWRPLDSLAAACLRPDVRDETALALFDSYDAFLGVLADADQRRELGDSRVDDLGGSEVFRRVSRLARQFQEEGIHRLFFVDDAALRDLITRHGVF